MNIIFCHGVMDPEQDWNHQEYNPPKNWKYWLQFMTESQHDILMQMPQFPHAHAVLMKYDEWEPIMNRQDINENTVLIGHSAGGGFVLKYFANHPELKVKQLVLVAPWCDAENWQPNGFYKNIDFDSNIIKRTKNGIDILVSDDDAYILSSVEKIKHELPDVRIHNFSGRGHFICSELPEVLQVIKFD